MQSERGYIGILSLVLGCALVAGLYIVYAPKQLKGDPSATVHEDMQLIKEAKMIQAASETRNAQYQQALDASGN